MMTSEMNKKAAEGLSLAGRRASDLMETAAEKAQAAANRVLDSTKATAQRLQGKAVSTAKATDECVRAHPYQTIAVFFGLGILAGFLLTRK